MVAAVWPVALRAKELPEVVDGTMSCAGHWNVRDSKFR